MIACIIVTYNRLEVLKRTVSFVLEQSLPPDRILVVDNCSLDKTPSYLSESDYLNYIRLDENLGYGAGLFHGIKYASENWKPDYFWLMDDDSFPSKNTLEFLITKMKENSINGLLSLNGFKMVKGIPRSIEPSDKPIEADFVLVDNAVLAYSALEKAGNFREDLFMMCEDFEYSKRLKKFEFFVGTINNPLINIDRMHLGSGSENSAWRGYYHSRNHFLIMRDYFSFSSMIYYFFRQSKYLIHAAFFGKYRLLRVKYRLLGIFDGLRGRTGKTIDPNTFIK
ncbi:MAG: glycosyltransferase [Bacteroidota bacterium]